jgi:hypothetical protein
MKAQTVQIQPQHAEVRIPPANMPLAQFHIKGIAPFVQLRFSQEVKNAILEKMSKGDQTAKRAKRPPRDYEREYKAAVYETADGWHGIPSTAFRKAMISACRLVNFKMTIAKLCLFVVADGQDKDDGTPLVRIQGEPHMVKVPVRNDDGSLDIRTMAMWDSWSADVTVRYDADQFSLQDVSNLLMRSGLQVGVGQGRPDGRNGAGMDWGMFQIAEADSGKK